MAEQLHPIRVLFVLTNPYSTHGLEESNSYTNNTTEETKVHPLTYKSGG
jgi:hypothetical protein